MFCVLCFRLEKEHSNVRKQLTNEVENKKSTIGSLSKELEVHQKNFIELKDELSKVGAVKEWLYTFSMLIRWEKKEFKTIWLILSCTLLLHSMQAYLH